MKKVTKSLFLLCCFCGILLLSKPLFFREETQITPEDKLLLQAIQDPEAIDVSQQNQQYSYRQVGFDPKEPQARCVNNAFFQANGSDVLGGYDTLGFYASVYFTGNPDQVKTIRLSYQTSFLYCYSTGFTSSFYPFSIPPLQRTKYFQYNRHEYQQSCTYEISETPDCPPIVQVYGADLNATHGTICGGKVIGGLCRISGEILCKDGTVYRPEATVVFSASCYR